MNPEIKYHKGLGNTFESEAVANSLPRKQNSPQKPPLGLYPEQIQGSSFTASGFDNQKSWLYKILPTVAHAAFERLSPQHSSFNSFWISEKNSELVTTPNQLRWNAQSLPTSTQDFVSSIKTVALNGDFSNQNGIAVHLYNCNQNMTNYFYDADGDLLIVPQEGTLEVQTEMGRLEVEPLEIIVIPRGIKFQVLLKDKNASGYICENFGAALRTPHLGPIGANGLANPRHFLAPTAWFEEKNSKQEVIAKFGGQFWKYEAQGSPLNVVAWWGNYYPYKYDLRLFNTINSVSFDHPDPSIYSVLTAPTDRPGFSNLDFVIFPPRWLIANDTFRPPYFHRNYMSEYMGLIKGTYDAKESGGFVPGGASLHNAMSGHGPDSGTFAKASEQKLEPQYLDNTMAFMFESRYPFAVTRFALESELLQKDYHKCWADFKVQFK
jgi:homogentisate 1,2-dioxygenase